MADYSIEIQRSNVTLAQFLRYVRQQCEKNGIYMEIDREEFENPYRPESSRYTVIDGQKKCHFAGLQGSDKPPAQNYQLSDLAGLYEILLHRRVGNIRRNPAISQ